MSFYDDNLVYATPIPVPVPLAPPDPVPVSGTTSQPSQNYTISSGHANSIDGTQLKRLKEQGFTEGLANSLNDTKSTFPLRIWVVDNSGSMQTTDGHYIVPTKKNEDMKIINCTRWKEIQECVNYHIQLSGLLEARTSFRLLNNPGLTAGSQQFDISQMGKEMIHSEVDNAMNIISKTRPSGCTPLTSHVRDIYSTIQSMKDALQNEGKRVVVVLATDGLPSNDQGYSNDYVKDQFVQSLRNLEGLPVWLVIRLCTDDEEVVEFYNSLDDQLELSMDVLDDFCGEAEEVYEHNPWMNYTLTLHRIREMGFHDRVLDMIDERPLTRGEVRDYCLLLFGVKHFDGLPDPELDWKGFISNIEKLLNNEALQWNPRKKKMSPWIDLKKLDNKYGEGSACSIM